MQMFYKMMNLTVLLFQKTLRLKFTNKMLKNVAE